jgi:hypothetical protein
MEYSTEIVSLLQNLELQRVATLEKFAIVAIIVFLINFLFFFKFNSNFLPVLGISFFVLVGSYFMLNTKYKTAVESDLLPKLVKGIDSEFNYLSDEHISIEDINSLKYFSHKIKNLDSDGTIKVEKNSKSAGLSFVTLESISTDTEEGEHETTRFDGAVVVLNLPNSFDQKYLLGAKKSKTVDFEAGDYLNTKNMGLKPVNAVAEDFMLYSENGNSSLDASLVKKVLEFRADLKSDSWAIFSGNHGYIFVDGIKGGFDISLLKSLKEQYFVANYTQLLKRVKGLIEE